MHTGKHWILIRIQNCVRIVMILTNRLDQSPDLGDRGGVPVAEHHFQVTFLTLFLTKMMAQLLL